MSNDKVAYRQILKVTSIFGGIHFFNILIGIIRTKAIAILIGPAGIGVISVLNATIDLIVKLTSCGIETSSVKVMASNENDPNILSKTIIITNRLSFLTGLLGAIVTLLLSEKLSFIAFGNSNYSIFFQSVSIVILLRQIINGKSAILQGLRKIENLAKANLFGSLLGLLISLPLYYFFKLDGVVPSIIISGVITYMIIAFYSKRSHFNFNKIDLKLIKTLKEGEEMIKLGFVLSVGSLITILASYLFQVYITRYGGIEIVGYYNAGFTILNSYVGVLFVVMATDYFPKLTAIIDDNFKTQKVVFEQIYSAILIITPVVVCFIAFSFFIVKVLYSKEFMVIVPMIVWGILGMLFKTVSWGIGYILIAKGDSRLFITNSLFFNIISLFLNVLGYYFFGLEGLGLSYFIYYVIHFIAMIVLAKRKYNFYLDREFICPFLICLLVCFATFGAYFITIVVLKWGILMFLVIISVTYSYKQLDRKMNFKEIVFSKLNNKK